MNERIVAVLVLFVFIATAVVIQGLWDAYGTSIQIMVLITLFGLSWLGIFYFTDKWVDKAMMRHA